jgi:pantoate--beta-alanine ligase
MRTLATIADARAALADAARPVGLVPTMGALHEGHRSLLARARQQSATVVMSLFVNPTQFGPGEDLAAYPRDGAGDERAAREAGVDLLFAPDAGEMYPPGFATTVSVAGLREPLEGAARGPEHFDAVATVVAKLLNIVAPQVAYFGQKDAQQALVIERMARDLDIPTRIEVCPTVREDDGLARSSRNAYLDASQREQASAIPAALRAVAAAIGAGERDGTLAAAAGLDELRRRGVEPEYLALADPQTLEPVAHVTGPVLVAVAARIGRARLIDNLIAQPAT